MAKGTYISENLTRSQLEIFQLLNEQEIDIFSLNDLSKLLSDKKTDINELIENLVHKNILLRIERGKYCRANFKDEKVIGSMLIQDGVLAYWTALNIHGLTEQFPNKVFIQTTKKKLDKSIFGVFYHFVKIKERKRTGIQKQGFGNHTYYITDKEKTIVDCFDLPEYCGGYPELIHAFCNTELDQDKLISYCRATQNISVIKRIAFLGELIEKKKFGRFLKYAEKEVNARYVLLDPFGSDKGAFNSKWKLRMNISEEEIKSICNKSY
jgi:predicted transcriptional regulator of viral defense system